MKKNYTKAEAKLFIYASQDIITLSVCAFGEVEEDSIGLSELFQNK